MKITRKQLLKQIADSRRTVRQLARLFPEFFDKNGHAITAVLTFPALPKDHHG